MSEPKDREQRALELMDEERERATAEANRRRHFMDSRGYRPCDIPACNCNSWHGGHAEARLADIYEELGERVNGATALAAIRSLKNTTTPEKDGPQ